MAFIIKLLYQADGSIKEHRQINTKCCTYFWMGIKNTAKLLYLIWKIETVEYLPRTQVGLARFILMVNVDLKVSFYLPQWVNKGAKAFIVVKDNTYYVISLLILQL